MFQDDRMISVLSAIVLMLAIGTVIQRADLVGDYFSESDDVVLNMDLVDAQANRLMRVDVFENDTGVSARDRDRLALIGQPSCGQVFIQGQSLQYLPSNECIGQNVIEYGIEGKQGAVGQVIAQVNGSRTRIATQTPTPRTQTPTPRTQSPALAAAEQDLTQPSEAAVQAQATPTVSETQAPTLAEGTADQLETQLSGVVDTLIQGTAQTASAASDDTLTQPLPLPQTTQPETEIVAASEPDPQTTEPEPSETILALAEPNVERALATPLATPLATEVTGPKPATVASTQSSQNVLHSQPAPTLEPSAQPQPAKAVKPQISVTSPALEIVQPREQRAVETADDTQLALVTGAERAPSRPVPLSDGTVSAADEPSGFLVAVVERREPNTRPPSTLSALPGEDLSLQSAPVAARLPRAEGAQDRIALGNPLQTIGTPDTDSLAALPSSPVDTSQSPPAQNSVLTSTPPPLKPRLARATDAAASVETPQGLANTDAARGDLPTSPIEPSAGELAALPRHDAPCVIPPAMTIDVRRAARSIIIVDAPCHADTVAELQYSGLRVAVPLDRTGNGSLTVLGFEPNAPALLSFINGETIDFDLPFKGIGRVSRVAVVWELPVALELNAVEFGADLGSGSHVRPDNPRGFEDVRRSGGGFLHSYRSHSGVGQNAQIYSFWHRRGGQQGAVELMIDYASRNRDRLEGTCGDGPYAAPNFLILRSVDARLERPVIRKLAALDCSRVAEEKGDKRLISGAVGDLLIVQK